MGARRTATLVLLALASVLLVTGWATVTAGAPSAPGPSKVTPKVPDPRTGRTDGGIGRRGAVSVARRGYPRSMATGFLLAPGLALTCRHVTCVHGGSSRRWDPSDLEIRLEDAEDPASFRAFPVLAYAHTSDAHDLCVLRIGPDPAGRLPDASHVRRLSTERGQRGDPLYVVHHPRGGRLRVSAGGSVVFPYAAMPEDVRSLEDGIRRELGCVEAAGVVREIRASYRSSPADGLLRNFSTRWAGQPTLGAICEAVDGSSGAPVFHGRTHALLGILYAGVDPRFHRVRSRWRYHEAILPSEAILADLAASPDPAVSRIATE